MTPWLPAPGWVAQPRDYVHFEQAPHTCGTAQSAEPRLGPVARVGEPIHSSAESPWIPWFCSPRTSSKLLHPCPPPAPLRPKPSRYCRQGWDESWAEQRVLLMESFPLQPDLARPRAAVPDVTQQTRLPEAPDPVPLLAPAGSGLLSTSAGRGLCSALGDLSFLIYFLALFSPPPVCLACTVPGWLGLPAAINHSTKMLMDEPAQGEKARCVNDGLEPCIPLSPPSLLPA